MPDILPGASSVPLARLRHVTRLDQEVPIDLSEISGNSNDQGKVWELIASYVNGATDLSFGIYRMEQGQYHPRHYHPAGSELYYIIEGSCLITVGDDDVDAQPGTAIYIPAGLIHAVRTRRSGMTMAYAFSRGDFRECGITWLE